MIEVASLSESSLASTNVRDTTQDINLDAEPSQIAEGTSVSQTGHVEGFERKLLFWVLGGAVVAAIGLAIGSTRIRARESV